MGELKPLDLTGARTVPLSERDSRFAIEHFVRTDTVPDVSALRAAWPKILKGKELDEFLNLWADAVRSKRARIFMFGAHVIKCGLGPLLNQLADARAISHLATHGAGALHDVEIALNGATSEDVDRNLADGSFGMARDTARLYFEAVRRAHKEELGLGLALGRTLLDAGPPHAAASFLCHATAAGVPVTVHATVGTDTLAQHPDYPAAELGLAAYRDFLRLGGAVKDLHQGGVAVNCGSAVILPEIFLKTLAAARNVDGPVTHFTTANFDMQQHYRPLQNVVRRPTLTGGRGFSFIGHHELLLPLVAWSLLNQLGYRAA